MKIGLIKPRTDLSIKHIQAIIDGKEYYISFHYSLRNGIKDVCVYGKPVKVMDDVSMSAVGQFHSLILKRDGSLWVQGFGRFGAAWLDKQDSYLVKVMDNIIWTDITAFGGYAITANHELWSWGLSVDGEHLKNIR